jgi:hypothetical protein
MSYDPPKQPRPTPTTEKSLDSISWKLKDISETLKRLVEVVYSISQTKSGNLF